MISVNDFAQCGLFVVSAFFFALGTGLAGWFFTCFDEDAFPVAAWLVAIIVYGITFTILYQMR